MKADWHLSISILCAFTVCCVVIPTAWVCDDAYISLRVADNVLQGYGLRWNVAERVQVFTHPLWLFLLIAAHAILKKSILTLVVPGILCTFFAVFALCRFVKEEIAMVVAVLLLLLSRTFMDFSTSGLENSLSYLLLILFCAEAYRGRAGRLFLFAGLMLLNRMDSLFLIVPGVLWLLWEQRKTGTVKFFILGMTPLIAWLVFSTIYYGAPLPNTYYAKLGAGIPAGDYLRQGFVYFSDVWISEPVLLAVMAAGSAAGFFAGGPGRFLAAGIALNCCYVLWIGGDFMSARFLTADYVAAVLIISKILADRAAALPLAARRALGVGGPVAALVLVAILNVHTVPQKGTASDFIRASGIADERAVYFRDCSLFGQAKDDFEVHFQWAEDGRALQKTGSGAPVTRSNIGFLGYYAGPAVYIIDKDALTDAFLARLPAQRPWRIGHFSRTLPGGYAESVSDGVNRIRNARVGVLLERIFLMTRAQLWSIKRWVAIFKMNSASVLDEIYMIDPGEQIGHDSPQIIFYSWSDAEEQHRWSLGNSPKIFFRIQNRAAFEGELVLRLGSLGRQTVAMRLNNHDLGAQVLDGWDLDVRSTFKPRLLHTGENVLEFSLPDAHFPDNADPRVLAIALKTLTVR